VVVLTPYLTSLTAASPTVTRIPQNRTVESSECGGNDRLWGIYAVEWNGTSKCAEVVFSGNRDYDFIVCVLCVWRRM